MLHKNPNAFFYRHNVPGEDTWHGEWAQEELDKFVEARGETFWRMGGHLSPTSC
jgi:hypothetical protein